MLEILFLLVNLAVRGWYCSSKNISDPIPMVAQPSSIPNFYLVVQSSCPNAIHCNSISSFRKEDMREERSHLKKLLAQHLFRSQRPEINFRVTAIYEGD